MNITEQIELIRQHNRWRRGDESLAMANPTELGVALDAVCDHVDELERQRDEARDVARAWRENWRNGASMSLIFSSKLPWENVKGMAVGRDGSPPAGETL